MKKKVKDPAVMDAERTRENRLRNGKVSVLSICQTSVSDYGKYRALKGTRKKKR